MPGRTAISALVLAGGAAQRLGGRKAGRMLGSRSMLRCVVDAVAPLTSEILLLSGGRSWAELTGEPPDAWDAADGTVMRAVADVDGVPGPLGGLLGGLLAMRTELALVVPCDMPFLQPEMLRPLCMAAREPGVLGAAWTSAGRPQPLPCVLQAGAAAAMDAAGSGGALIGALRSLPLSWLDGEQFSETFHNVNTPAELDAARARLGKRAAS